MNFTTRLRSAFTLVEILVVLVILGIASAIVIPQISSRDDLRAAAAARIIVADLVYAQNRAIATNVNQCIRFDADGQQYVLTEAGSLAPISHPVHKFDYR